MKKKIKYIGIVLVFPNFPLFGLAVFWGETLGAGETEGLDEATILPFLPIANSPESILALNSAAEIL